MNKVLLVLISTQAIISAPNKHYLGMGFKPLSTCEEMFNKIKFKIKNYD